MDVDTSAAGKFFFSLIFPEPESLGSTGVLCHRNELCTHSLKGWKEMKSLVRKCVHCNWIRNCIQYLCGLRNIFFIPVVGWIYFEANTNNKLKFFYLDCYAGDSNRWSCSSAKMKPQWVFHFFAIHVRCRIISWSHEEMLVERKSRANGLIWETRVCKLKNTKDVIYPNGTAIPIICNYDILYFILNCI